MKSLQAIVVALAFSVLSCAASQSLAQGTRVRALQVRAAADGDLAGAIQLADRALGTDCGSIHVQRGSSPSRVSTVVHLSRCHSLDIATNVTWAAPIYLAGENRVSGSVSSARQTIQLSGAWLRADNTSHIEVARLVTSWVHIVGGDNGNRILLCRACKDIFIHDTQTSGGGYIKTDSSANSYADVTPENSSYRIRAERNVVDGRDGPKGGIQGAWYSYTWDVDDVQGSVSNAGLAFSWWGGNNNVDWKSYDHPLKAGRMRFSNESISNVTAGWWGSMSENIRVTTVRGDGCEDVCLDSEGDKNVVFSHFVVSGAGNGELATFFHSTDVVFRDGEVLHRNASKGFGYLNNNATNNSLLSQNVDIRNVSFRCGDPSEVCALFLDPLSHLTIAGSDLRNTRIRNSVDAPEQGDVSILANTFTVDRAFPSQWHLLDLSSRGYGGLEICGNRFQSSVMQPPGTTIIFAANNYNLGRAAGIVIIGNSAQNQFPVHVLLQITGALHVMLLIQKSGFDNKRVHVQMGQFTSREPTGAELARSAAECRQTTPRKS